jgi:putative DNA primase/helicase
MSAANASPDPAEGRAAVSDVTNANTQIARDRASNDEFAVPVCSPTEQAEAHADLQQGSEGARDDVSANDGAGDATALTFAVHTVPNTQGAGLLSDTILTAADAVPVDGHPTEKLGSDAREEVVSEAPEAAELSDADRATVSRLAGLSEWAYERVRRDEARRLGVRNSALDEAVEAERGRNQLNAASDGFDEIEPWPYPVSGSLLLRELSEGVRRFIICNTETADAVALWVTLTWLIDVVDVAPIAMITAPEKRCGKSQLLALIGKLVRRPCPASNITAAALFRSIERWNPTLLIDEADSFLREKEELRGVLNSGHSRDLAFVIRTAGEDHTPTRFSTWGAKAIAGIGKLADTLTDRSIPLRLRRKLRSESVDRLRNGNELFDQLRAKLVRWCQDHADDVRAADPDLPEGLHDRAQDNWRPLLQIADVAGDEWPKRARLAAWSLSGETGQAQGIGIELLSDVREFFDQRGVDRAFTAQLVEALLSDPEKRWATHNNGMAITDRQVSMLLAEYDIHSKQVRIGPESKKGFKREWFLEAFARYLDPARTETAKHTLQYKDLRVSDCSAVDSV